MAGQATTLGKSAMGGALHGDSSLKVASKTPERFRADAVTSIDWSNINYPPGIRLVHFNPDELPTPVARLARVLHGMFVVTSIVLLANIVHSVVLVIGGLPASRIGYTIPSAFILTPASGATFYQGYVALAISDEKKKKRYFLFQSIFLTVALFLFVSPLGSANGLLALSSMQSKIQRYHLSSGMHTFWVYAAGLESTLWFTAFLLGAYGMAGVRRFNPYHSEASRSPA
ncbi:hypothetical protein NCLIV_058390 [Neospora caninum Liverpool]|uniref:Uncharacterized protein n=1 Tax=Neospora caninum (strain Liverpool) TaxID=572307 RepID=F0VNX0_NEOCL|nr:hypothetical protein NCLIV_058390 [Neospora caninum Liverpool]CBZ55416.1 hypothetical protein NCLIV_058390 [Neospora caninum Liverpool]CEL70152.1 TPA: hypothetical protein BN1204_058390 [Neospora caninum Liverpool]|eukprot:XP_003885444.1 hypothetical protein NCLIV_058390 [Neospora caninum Liverpool]